MRYCAVVIVGPLGLIFLICLRTRNACKHLIRSTRTSDVLCFLISQHLFLSETEVHEQCVTRYRMSLLFLDAPVINTSVPTKPCSVLRSYKLFHRLYIPAAVVRSSFSRESISASTSISDLTALPPLTVPVTRQLQYHLFIVSKSLKRKLRGAKG